MAGKTRTKKTKSKTAAQTQPMVGIAGIRGVVGKSLRLEEYLNYAQAFMADVQPRRLVVGSDTRLSREMLRHLVFAAAIGAGLEVYDLGIVPTPTVGLMVRELHAGGGIALTASHNPAQWNALKFFSARGAFLTPRQFRQVLRNYETRAFARAPIERLGRIERVEDPIALHLKRLLAELPVAAIRRRGFRVVLDACNGAGLVLAQELFRELGVEMGAIHQDQDRPFERPAEPLPENLKRLGRAVKQFKADVGFALDPDADRLAVVDETGRAIGEERTLALAAEYVLRHRPGPVATNLSTTRAIEDVAARHGVKVVRTPIGEAHVVEKIRALGAAIGGEGNGGVIWPRVHSGRDAAAGMGLVLALMAEESRGHKRRTVSEINATIPDYAMLKGKVDLPDRAKIESALERLERELKTIGEAAGDGKPKLDRRDGLKIVFRDRWLHVRASGTEPIMRLFAEAPDRAGARRLLDWAKGKIG